MMMKTDDDEDSLMNAGRTLSDGLLDTNAADRFPSRTGIIRAKIFRCIPTPGHKRGSVH